MPDEPKLPATGDGNNSSVRPDPLELFAAQLPAMVESFGRNQVELQKVQVEGRVAELRIQQDAQREQTAANERVIGARFEHDKTMEKSQRTFDKIVIGGVLALYGIVILYGVWKDQPATIAGAFTGLVSFIAGYMARPISRPNPNAR